MVKEKTNKVERLPITNDYIFKRVFAFEGNESILKDFLEAILKKDIEEVEIKNPEIIPYEKDEKRGLLDIKAPVVFLCRQTVKKYRRKRNRIFR